MNHNVALVKEKYTLFDTSSSRITESVKPFNISKFGIIDLLLCLFCGFHTPQDQVQTKGFTLIFKGQNIRIQAVILQLLIVFLYFVA